MPEPIVSLRHGGGKIMVVIDNPPAIVTNRDRRYTYADMSLAAARSLHADLGRRIAEVGETEAR